MWGWYVDKLILLILNSHWSVTNGRSEQADKAVAGGHNFFLPVPLFDRFFGKLFSSSYWFEQLGHA